MMPDEPEETYPPCHCGREMRKLNVAIDSPKCVGCGLPSGECRCQEVAQYTLSNLEDSAARLISDTLSLKKPAKIMTFVRWFWMWMPSNDFRLIEIEYGPYSRRFCELHRDLERALGIVSLGRSPDEVIRPNKRKAAIVHFQMTCQYCSRKGDHHYGPDGRVWHIDHLDPVVRGGKSNDGNLILSCAGCNLKKHDRDIGYLGVQVVQSALFLTP